MHIDTALNSVYSREPLTDFFALASGSRETIALDGGLENDAMRRQHNTQYSQIISSAGEYKLELDRHKDFLHGLGIDTQSLSPTVWLTKEDEVFTEDFFKKNNLSSEKTIALFAGVQVDIRRYDLYGEALAPICKESNFTVIGFGSENEHDFVQKQLDATGVKDNQSLW